MKLIQLTIIFTLFTVSCRNKSDISPQMQVSDEQMASLVMENDEHSPVTEISLPPTFKRQLSPTFANRRLFLINELKFNGSGTLKERINFIYNPSIPSEFSRNLYEAHKEKLNNNIQFIEGILVASGDSPNDPSNASDRLEFDVSLIKYTNPNDGQTAYYGAIEMDNDEVLVLYGNIFQITKFNKLNLHQNSPQAMKYQAIFTDTFDSTYEGRGLEILLGSYMTQRLTLERNYNINLELANLVYQGSEFEVTKEQIEALKSQENNSLLLPMVQEWSSMNINNYDKMAFSILYTNHPALEQITGETLGAAYIGQACVSPFKAFWVKGASSNRDQNQYLLDAHEISHMLDANHDEANTNSLMFPIVNSRNTYFRYNVQSNIDNISSTRTRVDRNGFCTNTRSSQEVTLGRTRQHLNHSTPRTCNLHE